MTNLKIKIFSVDFFPLQIFKVCFILSLVTFFVSCKKDVDSDCPKCPHVTAVTPNTAHFNDTVIISGKHLLPNPDLNDVLQVKFNGNLIPDENILSNEESSIQLIIPKGTQSGPVTVDINVSDELVSAGSAPFTYIYSYSVSTYAGSGTAGYTNDTDVLAATFDQPQLLTVNPQNGDVYVYHRMGTTGNFLIRRIVFNGGVETLLQTTNFITSMVCSSGGQVYCSAGTGSAFEIKKLTYSGSSWYLSTHAGSDGNSGHVNGTLSAARFTDIKGLAIDQQNNIYVAENYWIRKVTSTAVSTIAGTGSSGYADGPAGSSSFNQAYSLAVENDGSVIICDKQNFVIRKLDAAGSSVSTIAGSGNNGFSNGTLLMADLFSPRVLISDYNGSFYILEGRHCIRRINLSASSVSVFAGYSDGTVSGYADSTPEFSLFYNPQGLAYDASRNTFYIADTYNNRIRKITFE